MSQSEERIELPEMPLPPMLPPDEDECCCNHKHCCHCKEV